MTYNVFGGTINLTKLKLITSGVKLEGEGLTTDSESDDD